jgi:adenine-specific DNA methylase
LVEGRSITFTVKNGLPSKEPFVRTRKTLHCPCCQNTTSNKELKKEFLEGAIKERLIAVIEDSKDGKVYRTPYPEEITVVEDIPPPDDPIPELLATANSKQFDLCPWGYTSVGDMFTRRQHAMLQAVLQELHAMKVEMAAADSEYSLALFTYLGILVDRIAITNTAFGIWHTGGEKLERPMGRQAIAMVFDYPESNPFCKSTGSAFNQLDWITKYIENESEFPFSCVLQNAASGEREQFKAKSIDAVVTDPPYYDAMPYADLSDFFYAWLKRSLGDLLPMNFATPQTPKADECTALKYHHGGSVQRADEHFEGMLLRIFEAIEHQTRDMVSIMFAHQSTRAWTTLCNSILGANMNITGSWTMETEMTTALKTDKAFLESSVTVSARPAQRIGIGDFKEVSRAIKDRVQYEVELLYKLGFRGADLLTACFGQAVSEFGKYKRVEKADGSEVTVEELLELARESALTALLKNFDGDDYTKFSILWLQLYGFGEAKSDDATKFARVGIALDIEELKAKHLFSEAGSMLKLATSTERQAADSNLGKRSNSPLIDGVHRAMQAYKGGNRGQLLKAVSECGPDAEHPFWRVLTSLAEVLPNGSEDLSLAKDLLANKDNLLREARQVGQPSATQTQMGFDA